MLEKIRECLGSLNKSLEMFYLINDLKPVCRFGFYQNEISKVKNFCKENNLHMSLSNFKVLVDSRQNIGEFNNKGLKTSLINPFPGMVFAYVSKDNELSELAKYSENNNDHVKLGELLGYPDCCIDFFVNNMESQSKKNNDFVMPILKNSNGFRFDKEINIAARYFDFNLLPFFPHSFNCDKSLRLSKSYLSFITKQNPEIAADLSKRLSCGVLYSDLAGVFLLEEPKLKGDYLSFEKAISPSSSRLLDELNYFKRITILDKMNVIIGPNMLRETGVMIFE